MCHSFFKLNQTFIFAGLFWRPKKFMFILYDDSFSKKKQSNSNEVNLRAVLEIMVVCSSEV